MLGLPAIEHFGNEEYLIRNKQKASLLTGLLFSFLFKPAMDGGLTGGLLEDVVLGLHSLKIQATPHRN